MPGLGYKLSSCANPSLASAIQGSNDYGQLGLGSTAEQSLPTAALSPGDSASAVWTSVSTNTLNTCGIRTGGSVWCFGQMSAALGIRSTRAVPIYSAYNAPLTASVLVLGENHACASNVAKYNRWVAAPPPGADGCTAAWVLSPALGNALQDGPSPPCRAAPLRRRSPSPTP